MKKLIAALVLISAPLFAGTPTTRMGIDKVDDHNLNWGPAIRANYDIIDSSVAILSSTQTFTGTLTVNKAIGSNLPGNSAALGNDALINLRSSGYLGRPNVAIGASSLGSFVDGGNTTQTGGNVGVGYSAIVTSTGTGNTAIGDFAGAHFTYGDNNTFLGKFTGAFNTIRGENNILVGQYAGFSSDRYTSNSGAIGYLSKVGADSSLVLGCLEADCVGSGYPRYKVGIGTDTPQAPLHIDGGTGGSGQSTVIVVSTGPGNSLRVTHNGVPGSLQSLTGGAVNITVPLGTVSPNLVLVSSNVDAQQGAGILEIWQEATTHNDPHFWIHAKDHNSAGNIRIDSDAPNFEIVNTSTDNAHGFGKWEPFAAAYQSARMQVGSSRCYDNSGFDNLAYWEPLSKGGGLFLNIFDVSGCESASGFSASSQTATINGFDMGGHTYGLKFPRNIGASFTNMLPDNSVSAGGQLLAQQSSGGDRQWRFTTGGSAGQSPRFVSTSALPTWGPPVCTAATKATIGALTPTFAQGECYACTDCSTTYLCISTGTTAGGFSTAASRGAACN